MLWGFFGNLIFAIIARMLCRNHLNSLQLPCKVEVGCLSHPCKSFHCWEPAPTWRPLSWWATQLGAPAWKGEKQAPVTLLKQWKENERQGRGNSLWTKSPPLSKCQCSRKTLTEWKTATTPCAPRSCGILPHANIQTQLTLKEVFVLLVVYSAVKLRIIN